MMTTLSMVPGAVLKLLTIALGALYVGIVLMKYYIDGPHQPLRLKLQDPVTSAEHLVVGLGVKVLGACAAFTKLVLNILLEASAEVGEWTLRRSPEMQKAIRSRFLM